MRNVTRLLADLQATPRNEQANLVPVTIECVKARCTMGEIVEALKEVWASYTESGLLNFDWRIRFKSTPQ